MDATPSLRCGLRSLFRFLPGMEVWSEGTLGIRRGTNGHSSVLEWDFDKSREVIHNFAANLDAAIECFCVSRERENHGDEVRRSFGDADDVEIQDLRSAIRLLLASDSGISVETPFISFVRSLEGESNYASGTLTHEGNIGDEMEFDDVDAAVDHFLSLR
jgi:hypothetical protein